MLSLKIGDIVSWESQSRGTRTRKGPGKIVVVIPPYRDVAEILTVMNYRWRFMFDGRGMRNHESYLVAIGGALYWPRVRHLVPGG